MGVFDGGGSARIEQRTSSEAAIWGTHLGCTNDPASIMPNPVDANRLTSSILVSAGMLVFSFCNPSLGPTSTTRTWSAHALLELEKCRSRTDCCSRLRSRQLVRDAANDMMIVDVASVKAVQHLRVQQLAYIGNAQTSSRVAGEVEEEHLR